MHRARLDRIALAIALLLVAIATLIPGPPDDVHVDLCIACGSNWLTSTTLNVVLFLPFGFFAWRVLRRTGRVALIALAISFTIETLQYYVVPGRETALSDLLANTLGAFLGAVLARRPLAWMLPVGRAGRIAGAGAIAALALLLVGTGFFLEPVAPEGDYYVLWNPGAEGLSPYRGEVLDARIAGMPLPPERLPDPVTLRRELLGGSVLAVRFVATDPPVWHEPIFRLVFGPYGDGHDAYNLAVHRDALLIDPRYRADDVNLARPTLRADGIMAGVRKGDTVEVRIRRLRGRGVEVTVNGGAPMALGFTIGRGWTFIYAVPTRVYALRDLVDLLWLAGVAALMAWYARSGRIVTVGTALALMAAVATPWWSELLPTPPGELLALAGGAAIGWSLRRGADRLRQRFEGVQTS